MAPLRYHIGRVVGLGAGEQMVRPDAWGVVAGIINADVTVATLVLGGHPQPARVLIFSFLDLLPESLNKVVAAGIVATEVSDMLALDVAAAAISPPRNRGLLATTARAEHL